MHHGRVLAQPGSHTACAGAHSRQSADGRSSPRTRMNTISAFTASPYMKRLSLIVKYRACATGPRHNVGVGEAPVRSPWQPRKPTRTALY